MLSINKSSTVLLGQPACTTARSTASAFIKAAPNTAAFCHIWAVYVATVSTPACCWFLGSLHTRRSSWTLQQPTAGHVLPTTAWMSGEHMLQQCSSRHKAALCRDWTSWCVVLPYVGISSSKGSLLCHCLNIKKGQCKGHQAWQRNGLLPVLPGHLLHPHQQGAHLLPNCEMY